MTTTIQTGLDSISSLVDSIEDSRAQAYAQDERLSLPTKIRFSIAAHNKAGHLRFVDRSYEDGCLVYSRYDSPVGATSYLTRKHAFEGLTGLRAGLSYGSNVRVDYEGLTGLTDYHIIKVAIQVAIEKA